MLSWKKEKASSRENRILKHFILGALVFGLMLNFGCASTDKRISQDKNIQQLNIDLRWISSHTFDLKTRGEKTDSLEKDLEKCQALFQSKKYADAEMCTGTLKEEIRRRYMKEIPSRYVYENVMFEDVVVETTLGERVGFIAYPQAGGKYPGLIFLRGAGGWAMDIKRTIHYYAQRNYICLAPEFNIDDFKKGVVDLNQWQKVFKSHPSFDSRRLGLFSFSRGSYFAYKMIAANSPYKAWANWSGMVYRSIVDSDDIRRNPVPVLLVHGKKDKPIPIDVAYFLEKAYQEAGVSVQLEVFQDEGHSFSREARQQALEIIAAFFNKWMRSDT